MKKRNRWLLIGVLLLALLGGMGFWFHDRFYRISGPARQDLTEAFAALEGSPYEGKVLLEAASGGRVVVTETMKLHISCEDLKFWNDTMTEADREGRPFRQSGLISVFSVQGDMERAITVNGETVFTTHKYITYTGYEDNDINSEVRATLDPDSKVVTYSGSREEFEDVRGLLDQAEIK